MEETRLMFSDSEKETDAASQSQWAPGAGMKLVGQGLASGPHPVRTDYGRKLPNHGFSHAHCTSPINCSFIMPGGVQVRVAMVSLHI